MTKRPAISLLAVATLTLIVSAAVLANNPISVNSNGLATTWATPVNITYNTDGGTLGALSNGQANTLTSDAFGAWSGVATASVSAVKGAVQLTGDGDVSTLAEFNAMGCVGVNPIVYDTDGSLTDALLGAGAKNNVLGFAGPCAIQPAPAFPPGPDVIVGGRATMNGFLITGAAGLSYSRSKGVFIHELGHFLGIGHSQVNLNCLNNPASCPSNTPGGDLFGVPTMFPILLNQTEVANTSYSETLTVDDQSAISTLYPKPNNSFDNLGTLSGEVRFSDGVNEAQGINVIARRVGDPGVTAISNVSGMFAHGNSSSSAGSGDPSLRGDFMIPGLPAGTYTLEIESVNPSFIGGSRVGPLSGSTGRGENIPIPSPAVAECYGGPESNTDNPATCENQSLTVAGTVLGNLNFVLNETFATLDATDAVARNENSGSATPIGAGTFSRSMSGPNGADDQDYYALSVTAGTPISIEIRSRRLNPVRYLDSVIEIVSGAGGPPLATCRIGDATGAYDQVCMNDDYTPTGGSLTRDSKLQFMPGSTGVVILSVQDQFGDARPDFLYDLIIGGVAPVPTVTFSPTAEDFSSQAINTTSFPRDIEVVNNGAVDVTLNSFERLGANPNDFALVAPNAGTPCNLAGGTVLAAGGSCFFGLTFSPTTVGAYSATIRVNHSGGDSPSNFAVTGTGSGGPPNDLRANAITTDPSPFSDFQDTTLATQSVDDITLGSGLPAFSCNVASPPANNKSIWYKFTTPTAGNGSITATPIGIPPAYDVAVAIATFSGGVFTPQACANFNGPGIPESIGLTVSAGVELYFMAAAVNGDGGQTLINFTFTPNGIDADLSVTKTDNNLVFTEGSNGTYTITVTNSGTTLTSSAMPVTVRDFLPQGFSYVSSSGVGWACSTASGIVTCSLGTTTIAAGGNSQVTITVLPSAPAAANSPVTNSVQVFGGGDITQNNNFGQDTTNVNPAPAPVVDIAPPSKDFGSVGAGQTSAVQTFTLLNSGNGTLTVNGISKTGTDAGQFNLQLSPAFAAFTCPSVFPFNLTAGASCTFGVSFSPTGAGTTRSASVSVTSNASTSPNLVPLTGTNVPLGTLTGSATSFNFGSIVVGQSSGTQTFTLSNTGPGDLTVSALDVTGNAANSDDFQPGPGTTCNVETDPAFVPFPLASGASCDIVLAFTPTALGLREIVVTFSATNSTVSSVVVTLSGTGIGGNNTYTNANNTGLWQDDLNWSLGHAPNAQDTAIVNGVAPNSASVTLSSGIANSILALNMTSAGTLTINGAGTSLTFTSPSAATSLSIGGAGGGTLTANAVLAISGALNLNAGGTLNGTGNVTIASPLTWTGGTMSGSGTFTNNGAGANISGGTLDGKTFINSATGAAAISGFSMANSAAFNNAGAVNAQADGLGIGISAGAGATLTNTGTFTRSVGAGTYSIVGITFNNSGTINVNTGTLQLSNSAAPVVAASFTQTGGLTQVNTTFATGPTLNIQGGTLSGTGSVTPAPGGGAGGVNNTGGTVAPGLSPAIFAVSPSYTQGAGGTLNIEIGGTTVGTDYDQLNAGGAPGTATLAGTLNVTLINGFVPVLGNSFTIVTSGPGATTGTFATTNLPALGGGLSWRVTYNATSVVMDVVAASIALDPDPLNFGNVKVNTTTFAQTITVTNSGGAAATLSAGTPVTIAGTNPGDFAIVGGTTTCVANFVLAAGGGSCVINLTFTPGALGGRTATVNVASDAPGSPHTSTVNGTGVLANVTVTPNPVNFGSVALTTTSAASTITVTNTGTLQATLAAVNPVTITGAQAGDFAIVGGTTTCVAGFVLTAGGGSCVIDVTFTPNAEGVSNATVNVFDDAPGSPQQTALTGTGVQSAITLNPSPVNFGNQRVGTTSGAMTVTVTNTGTLAATLDAGSPVTIIGANAGDFAIVGGTTTCVANFVLNANGGSCIVDITFTPPVTGARTATLNISDSDPNSPQQATLNGTGVLANVTLAPNPLNFGDQRQNVTSAAQTITVTNTGNENATLTAGTPVTIAGANAGDFAIVGGTTTCVANFVLNANGGSCVINIAFTPSALGARPATVNVADDAPGSPQQATLNGTGVLANMTLAPDPLNFGNQKVLTTSGAMTITATNTGTEAATLAAANAVTFTGLNSGDFAIAAGTTCVANFVIAPGGGSCVINITFTPGALGARTATVNLADDAPGSPQQATLNGTGVLANVTVAPNPVNFGSVALNITSAASTITVTNTGTLAATLAAVNPVTITGADFAIVGGTTTCVAGFVLNAGGGSCVVNVTFTPTVLGVRNATLNVFDDAPASPQQTALTGTGVQSLITLNPSPVNFGNQKVLTTSGAMTVTVTNTGTLAATLDATNSVTIIGANAGDFAVVGGTTTCVDNFVLAANGGSCIVDITFTPSVTGARTATLSIADSDPNSPQQAVLNGTGVLANVTAVPNPVAFAARIVNTASAAMTVTVTNTGTLAATLAAANPVTITGAEAADFAIVGGTTTCIANFVLAAGGGSCVVDVTFTPGASGARGATLNVFDDAPASPQQTALTGTGQTAPTADFSTTNINFPDTRVGQSTMATTVTVSNNGEFPLEMVSLSLTGTDPSQFVLTNSGAGSCSPLPKSVPGGGNCTFTVAFAPTSLLPAAAKSANVSVSHNGNATGTPGAVTDVGVAGTAIQANVTLTANPTAFGNQRVGTASAAMTVTVTNSGTDVATLAAANAVTVTGANFADFVNAGTGTCVNGLVLAASPGPGNTCTINIVFTPSATGARAATVNVADDAPGSPQMAALTGTGIQANITLAPNPANFGNVKVGTPSAPLTVTVTNSGTDAATLAAANAVTITGANAAEFVNAGTGTCANGLVLASSPGPGNTCTVDIVFTPTALGARGPVTLNIADDAPGTPQTATLNGTGVLANLTLAPSPLNFGGLNLGSNGTMSITVTNTGTLAATLGAGTPVTISGTDAGDFAIVGGTTTCVANFVINAGGGSCIISVRFAPTALGARAAQVDVANDAPGNPHPVPLSGTGAQPGFNLSSTSVTTWPTVAEVQVGMTGTSAAVTLTNPAGANAGPLTINSITKTGANAADFSFVSNCPLAPAALAAGANCTITPSMSPQAGSFGPLVASISISHDAAAGSPGTITLTGTAVDFALITTATPATVTAGASATYTLNLDTAGGNSLLPTTFACSGLPRKAECIFNPSMIPAGSPDTTVTLTITTTSNTVTVSSAGVAAPMIPTGGGMPPGGWLAIGISVLGLFTLASMKRQALRLSGARLCLLGLLLVAGGYAAGCAGDGDGFPEGASGTPPGSYTVTVTATSGTVQRTTNITLNVQ